MRNLNLTRRGFLGGVGVLLLARCGGDDRGKGGGAAGDSGIDSGVDASIDAGDTSDVPYGVWRAMRDALRTSPDHLPARAAALIAAKDMEGMFAFVRDAIITLPKPVSLSYATQSAQRWGVRGTLRGGAGTPRERAELLAWMLQQAGFTAKVVAGPPDAALAASMGQVYGRSNERNFDPAAPPAPADSWAAMLGGTTSPVGVLDPDGTQTKALADGVLAALPKGLTAPQGVASDPVPLVEIVSGGQTIYANPLLPTAELGKSYVASTYDPLPAGPLPSVKATLSVSRADAPHLRETVASLDLGLDELIGRQLSVRFAPALPFEVALDMPLGQLPGYVPLLSLGEPDWSQGDAQKKSALGKVITVGGDVIGTDGNGGLLVNGAPIDDGGNPALAAQVKSLTIEVNASAFPQIELAVSPRDAGGTVIDALPASVFALTEDTAPMGLVMRANSKAAPRVLFVVDCTGSQPAPFQTTGTLGAVGQELAAAVLAAAPDAKMQAVGLGGPPPSAAGYALTTAVQVATAFEGLFSPSSPIFGSLQAALASGPSLIILLSDGVDSDGPPSSALKSAVSGGAPVLAVSTAATPLQIVQATLDEIAALSGGSTHAAGSYTDPASVATAVKQFVESKRQAPYRFSYRAPKAGGATRSLDLKVGSSGAKGSYTVPAQPSPARALASIRLTLEMTGSNPVHCCLGGWDSDLAPAAELKQSVFDDVAAALRGAAVVSFEAGAPGLATWFDDIITARLSTEAAFKAALAEDRQAFLNALGDGVGAVPTELMALHSPLLDAAKAPVHEVGPRVVLLQYKYDALRARRADILPLTRFGALTAATPEAAFEETVRASLRLAVAEQALYAESTASLLQGKPLQLLAPGVLGESDVGFVAASQRPRFVEILNRHSDSYRLAAADGSTLAFWAVHEKTGTTLGILPDGTGGGSAPGCDAIKDEARYFEALKILNKLLDIPDFGVLVLMVLGKWTAITAIKAAICLTGHAPPGVGNDPLVDLACQLGKALLNKLIGSKLPKYGGGLGGKALQITQGKATGGALDLASGQVCPPSGC